MSKINVRSPYYIYDTVANLTSDKIDIYIYTGTQGSRPSTPTYQLTSNAIDDKVTFEISELIKDYFTNNFDGDYVSDFFWVDYEIYRSVSGGAYVSQGMVLNKGFYGYGFFEDGANPQNSQGLLQSNTTIVKLDDAPATIAVDTSTTSQVTYELNGQQVYTKAISSSTNSNAQIEYVTSGINGSDEFEDRVIQDGGIFEGSDCLSEFSKEYTLFDFDTIYVDTTSGVTKLTVKSESECKFTPYKVTFINKFGALQDIWFFKRTNETLTTKQEKYKRNTVVNGSYDISKHQNKTLTKNGKEKLTLNTGYYPESYNDVFKEMQLSEDCWIEINSKTLPIQVTSSSLAYKTQLNDKIINYTIEVEFAFDTINNIR
jgi:hypothetical protein